MQDKPRIISDVFGLHALMIVSLCIFRLCMHHAQGMSDMSVISLILGGFTFGLVAPIGIISRGINRAIDCKRGFVSGAVFVLSTAVYIVAAGDIFGRLMSVRPIQTSIFIAALVFFAGCGIAGELVRYRRDVRSYNLRVQQQIEADEIKKQQEREQWENIRKNEIDAMFR